ncbi:MAG: LptF/LptG family permease [Rhizobiaceae bacterium]|nr:LptF/LptG family permease [Rhizobiaceae bacterium]
MKQIERYIFGRIATITLWAAALITILALTSQVLIRVNVLTTSGSALTTFMTLAASLVPKMFVTIVPFALLIGIGRILTTMNDDSELVVIEASGASNKFIVKPVVFISVLISVLTILIANFVTPPAARLLYSTISNANSDIISIAINAGGFQKIEDDLYIHVGEKLSNGEMSGIFLSDRRDPSAELLYYARSGAIINTDASNLLVMRDGQVHRGTGADDQTSVIQFSSYALDMQSFIPTSEAALLRPAELYLNELLNPETAENPDLNWQRFYASEIHERLSGWLYPIVFGLIMVAFLGRAQSHRSEKIHLISTAVWTCVLVRLAGGIALEQTEKRPEAAYFAYIIPIVTMMYFSMIIIRGRRIKLPKFWVKFGEVFISLAERLLNRPKPDDKQVGLV